MIIGIPKEIKEHEYRVGATPQMVRAFVDAGHRVVVEANAGEKIGFSDALFQEAGAEIVAGPKEVYQSEMIVKVKEPQPSEFPLLFEGQILFCYLHLAPDPEQTEALLEKKVVGIAYETVTDALGRLPLLVPMSEIAGRIAIQAGAVSLQMNNGGKGLLLGGVPGVFPANVVVIGGGVVGTEAARMAMGLGANVAILDRSLERLRYLDAQYAPKLKTLYSSAAELENVLKWADLVIGAVLIPGKKAPKLISRSMLRKMIPGSVIVDVAIDQGGCAETSRPTTHGNPTYVEEGVLHYCVTNMPGACAKTATMALTNATMEYALEIANKGYRKALKENSGLLEGLNVHHGSVTNISVAHDLGYAYVPPQEIL
ncbi:Alanine dehydrogenase [Waddlia chondrophila 2032/99]|uniref:Alanine dehydrogenase n=2 Tax=Waddlia chondrophila TaxID=71667 RepID=D6YSC8_WADCW|nr:alanine dehydrogenase [Waddlia chondrophila]ADI38973.1 Alanine dehydrogenase [Waddlia chondrophila WSU 86-1044]CCB92094.1 Alanine dehydrogenase [Waddlia chondrophila 2032/99]